VACESAASPAQGEHNDTVDEAELCCLKSAAKEKFSAETQ